jgi:histidinol-phosphate aminotransferase
VNVAALVAAEAAIRDRAFLRKTVSEVRSSRNNLERGLARLHIQHFPSAGNFILVNLGDRVKEIVSALARREILIRDRSSDFGGAGYARITVGTVSQTRQLLRQLEEIL